jgi:hypothetical protein
MKKVAITSIVFAVLSLMGSCQPAPVLAQTTRAAATKPATQPLFSISPVSSAAPSPSFDSAEPAPTIYTIVPAPATVHVSLLNLLNQPTDWFTETDHWNFGDTNCQYATDPTAVTGNNTVNLNSALQGPVAAYLYEQPGTYTITLVRTFASGQSQTLTAKVIVPPAKRTVYFIGPNGNDVNPGTDPNHPLKTATAAAKLSADHTEFRFQRGSVYQLEPEFSMKHNDILIDCCGNATQPLPVIQRIPAMKIPAENCLTFTTWPGQTSNITIRHLRIDSPWTAASTGGYAYHAPSASFSILRGSNVTVADCEFQNILEGPHGDPTLTDALFLRNRQVDPLGIPSRTLWLEGQNVVAIGNDAVNSINESPLRAASTGIIGGLVAFNDVAQQLDPAHNRATVKAAITLRTLADVTVMNNRCTNGEFSFDPHDAAAVDQRIRVINNSVFNTQIDLQTNIRHALFTGNFIQRDQGPCITINPGGSGAATQWIEDLQLINNTGQGWMPNGRMLQINAYGPNQLRGFVCDPAKNIYTKIAASIAATQPAH